MFYPSNQGLGTFIDIDGALVRNDVEIYNASNQTIETTINLWTDVEVDGVTYHSPNTDDWPTYDVPFRRNALIIFRDAVSKKQCFFVPVGRANAPVRVASFQPGDSVCILGYVSTQQIPVNNRAMLAVDSSVFYTLQFR